MTTWCDEAIVGCLVRARESLVKEVERLVKETVEDLQLELEETLRQVRHEAYRAQQLPIMGETRTPGYSPANSPTPPSKVVTLSPVWEQAPAMAAEISTASGKTQNGISAVSSVPMPSSSQVVEGSPPRELLRQASPTSETSPSVPETEVPPNDEVECTSESPALDPALHNSQDMQNFTSQTSKGSARSRLTSLLPFGAGFHRTRSRMSSSTSEEAARGRNHSNDYIIRIVKHQAFETVFSILILINCGLLGIQAHGQVTGSYSESITSLLQISEHIFTLIFSLELLMRMYVYGLRGFNPCYAGNRWNVFDGVLVLVAGIFVGYLLPAIAMLFETESDSSLIRTFTVLRAIRLLRIARVLQRSPLFHEAWLLIRGLSDSLRTLFWTCIVIFLMTYIFAVFGLVMISLELKKIRDESDDPVEIERINIIMESVGGLDVLMATLIQLLTMDSWNAKINPIKEYIWYNWVYFYSYIALAVFVLMNLVTAIIVENAVTNGRLDEDQALRHKEKAKKSELKELENLFFRMDSDGNGKLSWEEFKGAFDDAEMAKKWKLLDFEPDECREVFSLLDDGDGEIETQEFFDGLGRMKGVAQSKDIFRLVKQLEKQHDDVAELLRISELVQLAMQASRDPSDGESDSPRSKRRAKSRKRGKRRASSEQDSGTDTSGASRSPRTTRTTPVWGTEVSPRDVPSMTQACKTQLQDVSIKVYQDRMAPTLPVVITGDFPAEETRGNNFTHLQPPPNLLTTRPAPVDDEDNAPLGAPASGHCINPGRLKAGL